MNIKVKLIKINYILSRYEEVFKILKLAFSFQFIFKPLKQKFLANKYLNPIRRSFFFTKGVFVSQWIDLNLLINWLICCIYNWLCFTYKWF